ncbi:MAG: hypothetical protein Q7K25_09905 [Actinomycetota bacterium]|nr:hypothetical protein [Actinomycetota bacterium]
MKDIELGKVKTVLQPWGKEEVFADIDGRLVGKVLHVRAGERMTIEANAAHEEVVSLMSGAVWIDQGDNPEHSPRISLAPGQTVHIAPGTAQQISATENSMLLEVSTSTESTQNET